MLDLTFEITLRAQKSKIEKSTYRPIFRYFDFLFLARRPGRRLPQFRHRKTQNAITIGLRIITALPEFSTETRPPPTPRRRSSPSWAHSAIHLLNPCVILTHPYPQKRTSANAKTLEGHVAKCPIVSARASILMGPT